MKLDMLKTTMLAGAFALAGGAAMAATFTSTGTCMTTDLSPEADACFGTLLPTPINDNNVDFENDTFGGTVGLFGYEDWTFLTKVNTGTGADEGNDFPEGTDIGLELNPDDGAAPGVWSVDEGTLSMYEYIAIILKQGNTFAAYLYEDVIPESGGWSSEAFNFCVDDEGELYAVSYEERKGCQDNSGGLSHFSIYVGPEGETIIPLPAAGWLLLGGLGGLAAMRRRKKA